MLSGFLRACCLGLVTDIRIDVPGAIVFTIDYVTSRDGDRPVGQVTFEGRTLESATLLAKSVRHHSRHAPGRRAGHRLYHPRRRRDCRAAALQGAWVTAGAHVHVARSLFMRTQKVSTYEHIPVKYTPRKRVIFTFSD